jgi:large subunit ribosomal protein L19
MPTKFESFVKGQSQNTIADIRPGDVVKVLQKIKDKDGKDRLQAFEGLVLARKHGQERGATITVRKVASGIGVERTFPLHSPAFDKIEIVRKGKARRAKLYYLRTAKGKRAKLKKKGFAEVIAPVAETETAMEKPAEE